VCGRYWCPFEGVSLCFVRAVCTRYVGSERVIWMEQFVVVL